MLNYGYLNPIMTPQQRLAQMETQYSQFATPQPLQSQGFKVIPVTNIEEANASQVDLQGNPVFFYNKGRNEIYLKQFNITTGLADFYVFAKVEQTLKDVKPVLGVNTYEKDFKALNDKIDGLYAILKPEETKQTKKGVKNDE